MSHKRTINEKSKIAINKNDRLASDKIGFVEKQYDRFGAVNVVVCDTDSEL